MRRVPGGPDGEELSALVAAAEADLYARLLDGVGFPVLAPVDPWLEPRYLSAVDSSGDVVERVELATGDVLDGPMLAVATQRLTEHAERPLQTCVGELADFAGGLVDGGQGGAGGDVGRPPVPVTVTVTVDGLTGLPAASSVAGLGSADRWVAVLDVPEVGLRLVLRGRAVPAVARLTVVDDLSPWTSARPDALAAVAAAFPSEPEPEVLELPPVRGFEAHEALVALVTGNAERLQEDVGAGRRPSGLPGDWSRSWEHATRAQMQLAGEDRRAADEAVTALVNHVTALDEEQLLGADRDLRAAAVAECIRWTVFASQVPSEPAQLAWQERWSERTPQTDLRWRTAWAQWLQARRA